jgi:hypothetical protein
MSLLDFSAGKFQFYGWECLTICLQGREVDLVIKNEACMIALLKLLIYRTQTVDGKNKSGIKIMKCMYRQEKKKE